MIKLTLDEVVQAVQAVLVGQNLIFNGCSTDTRQTMADALYVALSGQHFDGHDFVAQAQQQGAVALMVEKPVTTTLPYLQVSNTRLALGQLAHYWRQQFNDLALVAVTGSNGKTTVKEMLHCIFSQQSPVLATQGNLNNEVGVPLTLFRLSIQHKYAVIEMGANHPGEIAYLTKMAEPHVAVITQCAPAHLEGFKDIEGVAQTKGEIFSGLQAKGTAVINEDDQYAPLWRKLAQQQSVQIKSFALDHPADVTAQNIQLSSEGSDFTLQTAQGNSEIHLALLGRHNVMNALAASACALACGCSLTVIKQGLSRMQPVAGRLQRYPGINNTILLDDTYNANPASLNAALQVLSHSPSPRWLVLGDMYELGPNGQQFHAQAGRQTKELGIERLWAVGHLSCYALAEFGAGARHFANHDILIDTLKAELRSGTTLLIKGSRSMQMEKVVNALRIRT